MSKTGAIDNKLSPGRGAISLLLGFLVEESTDVFSLTTDSGLATHGLIDTGGDVWEIVPVAELDGSLRLFAKPNNDFIAT